VVIVGFFTTLLDPFSSLTILFVPPLPEKTPKAMADKGKQPLEENSFPPKKRTIREYFFPLIPCS
jgi:hypothetical protein